MTWLDSVSCEVAGWVLFRILGWYFMASLRVVLVRVALMMRWSVIKTAGMDTLKGLRMYQ